MSLRTLARAHGLSHAGVARRLRSGIPLDAPKAQTGGRRRRYTDPEGRTWASLRAMADAYGIHVETVRIRLKRGASIRVALTRRR